MSGAGSYKEQFRCSICLEVFAEPVSTPCGHNYCKHCISQAWDNSQHCFCPLCKEVFHTKPELKTNTLLSTMISQLKQEAQVPSKPASKPVHVFCTFCTEPRLKAVKSCLVCLSSFCETHLQPHLSVPGLRTHPLTLPLENMEDRMCAKHQRPLELFCGTELCCVCSTCALLEHKNHELLSLEEAFERRRASLQRTQAQSQHMLEQRRLKVQEIQRCVALSQREAHRETTVLVTVFTDIVESVQKCLDHHTKIIEEAQSIHKKKAQRLISELEQEMCELEKISTEAQPLYHSSDPLHFLHHCPALLSPAGLKEWSSLNFEPEMCEGNVARALSELEHTLSKKFSTVFKQKSLTSQKVELSTLQQFSVDITLDPATAHPELVLSKDLKQVHHSDVKKWLPLSPHRFDRCANVLGKQSFSSGRVYFEIQVKGKTECDLGVAHESIKRKGQITASPQHGQWSICLRKSHVYSACTNPWTPLSLRSVPQKIGVFVDYEARLVSFFDANSKDLIYSFTDCCFRDKLLPLLSPCNNNKGTNSAPLIITAVL